MNVPEWIVSALLSSTVTVLLISAAIFLTRSLIVTRLRASVQHEFDAKLEALRADLRKSEEAFKADLRAKEAQIDVLRSGALSTLVSRQATLDKRRLEAVEQLWAGIEALAPLKFGAGMMGSIKFKEALEEASKDSRAREALQSVGRSIDIQKFPKMDVQKSRPFVSELAWALFSAYQAILGFTAAQVHMLKIGLNSPELLDEQNVSNLVKVALPHYKDYIDKFGYSAYYYVLEPLESELLKELRRMMRGEESDKTTLEQTAKINELVHKMNEQAEHAKAEIHKREKS